MRYIHGFRDGGAAAALSQLIEAEVDATREYHLMEFCGGHTHAIFRYGVEDLLPKNVRLVHGPGCPVCVLAMPRLDAAIELASKPNVTLVSYGDMVRVPASRRRSLLKARAQSILDAPGAAGEDNQVRIDGFIGPSHVSAVIGSAPYEAFSEVYQKPVVIAGFEPLDVMQAVYMLVKQINDGRACVENQFTRGVTRDGNLKAQAIVAEVLELRPSFEWRGLGELAQSAMRIKSSYAQYDAEKRFVMQERPVRENAACQCPSIIRGMKKPTDCTIFGTVCTPRSPIGSCMVSAEGVCAAYYKYRRIRSNVVLAADVIGMPA